MSDRIDRTCYCLPHACLPALSHAAKPALLASCDLASPMRQYFRPPTALRYPAAYPAAPGGKHSRRVEPRWSESLERASCLMEADVVPCVIEMLRIYEEANATQRHESPISAHQAAQEMLMVGAQQQQQHADLLKTLSRSANVSPVPWMLHTEAAAEEMDDDFRRVTNC